MTEQLGNDFYIKDKNRRILSKLVGTNILDDEDFIPFIDYIKTTDWYINFQKYCAEHNLDFNLKIRNMCYIYEFEIGYDLRLIPSLITKYDIQEGTDNWINYRNALRIKLEKL